MPFPRPTIYGPGLPKIVILPGPRSFSQPQIETSVTFCGMVWLRVAVTATHHPPLRAGTAVNPGPLF